MRNLEIAKIKSSAKSLAKKSSVHKPSKLAKEEREKIEQDALKADVLNRQLNNQAYEQIIELRKKYSKYILICKSYDLI